MDGVSANPDSASVDSFMNLPSDLKDITTWYSPRKKRFWALVLVASYTLAGFFLVPWALKKELPGLAQQFLLRDAQVQRVQFNPWTLRLQASKLEVTDEDGSRLANFEELVVNLQLRSILQFALVFDEVSLTAPEFHLVRYAFGDSNIGRILNDLEANAATEEDAKETEPSDTDEGFRLVIVNLNIIDGRIQLSDAMPDTDFNTTLEPINISVTNLSTLPDSAGAQQIDVTTETGAQLKWTGSLELSPLISSGNIAISGSPLPLIYRYFSDQLGFRMNDCCLEVTLNYSVNAKSDGGIAAHVSDLNVSSRKVEMLALDSDDSILMLPELRISGGDIKWPDKTVRVDELLIDKPDIGVWIDNDGVLNLNTLILPEPDGSDSAEPETPRADTVPVEAEKELLADSQESEWDISLAAFRIIGLKLGFEDRSLAAAGQLDIYETDIRISEISNRPDVQSPFAISARLGETGSVKLNGTAGFLPAPVLDAKLTVAGLAIPAFQPWVQELASISINKGTFGLEGSVRSAATEQLEVLADIYIDMLAINDTLENEALVGWKKLELEQTRLQLDAGRLEISRIKLNDPFARLIIAADGTTNFQSLARDDTSESGDLAPEATVENNNAADSVEQNTFVFGVGKTIITNGSMDFSDFSLPLPFRALISKFGGELSALSSDSRQPSTLNLEGQVGEYGLVNVGGLISVMAPTDQSSIAVDFRNINMADLSPYTAEFAGRKIASGKLDLDLDYGFTDRKMVGENKIVLEKFELGDTVEHPEAMSLPLDLAIALLRDVNGVIDLQLKVSGDLDDPEFSASGIVLKAFANLITKLVAAPFKLLGGLIPGGENVEFDAVDFQPGRADLAPPEREKLDQLAEALTLRPALQLKVPGGYNRDSDRQALQSLAVDTQLTEMLGDDTADEQEMLGKRTRKALEKLARQQLPDLSTRELRKSFKREGPAADGSTFDEVAYTATLRQQLEDAQAIDDIQLIALAETRRAAIISQLTAANVLDPAQLTMVEVAEADVTDDAWIRLELSLETAE